MLFLSTLPHRPWPHFTSWHFRLLILSLTKCSPMYLVLHSKNTPRPILIHAFVLSCFSCVWLFVTQWTLARQAPLSTGFSRQEHWSGLPSPPPNPGIQPRSLKSSVLTDGFFTTKHHLGILSFPILMVALIIIITSTNPSTTNYVKITSIYFCTNILGFPNGTNGKESACQWRRHKIHGFYLWVGKIPWRRAWQPTPVFLPGASHGQRT